MNPGRFAAPTPPSCFGGLRNYASDALRRRLQRESRTELAPNTFDLVAYAKEHRYVAMDGGELSVCLFFKSFRGVSQGVARLREIGARIDQVGDAKVRATLSPARIEEVMDLINVSKLRPGDVDRFSLHTEPVHEPESSERRDAGSGRYPARRNPRIAPEG